jgi:vancomycin resistance protein YoaR
MEVGRTGGVFSRIGSMFSMLTSKHEIEVQVKVDEQAVNDKAGEIVRQAETEKKEYSYEIRQVGISVSVARPGRSYDVSKLIELITDRYKSRDYSVMEFPGVIDEPRPLDLQSLYDQIYVEPKDATLSLKNGENTVVDHVDGVSFDLEKAEKMIKDSEGGDVFIPFIIKEPSITKEQLEAMLFRDVLTDTYTRLTNPGLVNRTHNVKLAASFVNGKILLPGEIFSYNDVVGKRTVERGFRDAKVFVKGEIVDDIGGGICQVSSTIYMAALFSNLEITERKNHTFIVDYTKLGEDATVYYGSVDFKFKNNTAYPIKIVCELNSPYLKVKILGTKTDENKVSIERVVSDPKPYEVIYKPDSSIAIGAQKKDVDGHTGYTVNTYRVIKDAKGKVISRTFEAKSVYKKLDEVILVNPADPVLGPAQIPEVSPTPSPETTPEPTPTPEPTEEPAEEPTESPSDEEDLYYQPV